MAALKFLDEVKCKSGAAALLLMIAISERPPGAQLPPFFDIVNMASFIVVSNAEASDNKLETHQQSYARSMHTIAL